MAKESRCLNCWIEVAPPAIPVFPFKVSNSPSLETITEDEETEEYYDDQEILESGSPQEDSLRILYQSGCSDI
ncbi:hypothetical protein ACOSP7_029655 [Xanthoceras sorbifolium]